MSKYIVRYTLTETREIVVVAASEYEAEQKVISGKAFDSQSNPLFALDKWIHSTFAQVQTFWTRKP